MQGDEARVLLGFPPNSRPTASQVKAAYRRKVWESHPDLFPVDKKIDAESKFKLISEAYTYLLSVLVIRSGFNFDACEEFIRGNSASWKIIIVCAKCLCGGM